MPLYEFVLRADGYPDEVRLSDHNPIREGDRVTIAGRRWRVVGREAPGVLGDGVQVQGRFILTLAPGEATAATRAAR